MQKIQFKKFSREAAKLPKAPPEKANEFVFFDDFYYFLNSYGENLGTLCAFA